MILPEVHPTYAMPSDFGVSKWFSAEFDAHFSATEDIESISINVSVSCATWADLAARQAKGSRFSSVLVGSLLVAFCCASAGTGREMVVK